MADYLRHQEGFRRVQENSRDSHKDKGEEDEGEEDEEKRTREKRTREKRTREKRRREKRTREKRTREKRTREKSMGEKRTKMTRTMMRMASTKTWKAKNVEVGDELIGKSHDAPPNETHIQPSYLLVDAIFPKAEVGKKSRPTTFYI